jgi:hypothetical protein
MIVACAPLAENVTVPIRRPTYVDRAVPLCVRNSVSWNSRPTPPPLIVVSTGARRRGRSRHCSAPETMRGRPAIDTGAIACK